MKRSLCLAIATACAAATGHANAGDISVEGRLHLDYAAHDADIQPLDDRFVVRRAKLGVEGDLNPAWSFEVAFDFANIYDIDSDGVRRDGQFKGGFDDVRLRYSGWSGADFDIGQFKLPFGLEEMTSSNNLTMVERSLPTEAFVPSRRLGLGVSRQRADYTLAAMAFGRSIDGDERGHGVAARATFAPIHDGRRVLHFGVAAIHERSEGEVDIDARPESRPSNEKFVDTGDLRDVRSSDRIGLEAAWRDGPFSIQGEWINASLERDRGFADARFHGGYVMASWFPGGQMRAYKNGEFKGMKSETVGGAWELTARASRVDLDSGDVAGGSERNLSVGVNYYASKHLRIMANVIKVSSERRGVHDDPAIALVRLQLVF